MLSMLFNINSYFALNLIQDYKLFSPPEEGYRTRLTDEIPKPTKLTEETRHRKEVDEQSQMTMKTSFMQPQSHQQLLSLLPPSSIILPSSTLQQPSQQSSTIIRAASEINKKSSMPQTTNLKRNVVADLFSSKNRSKR